MRQYSIDQVELAWNGLDLVEGLASGTSVQEARVTQSFSQKMTARGKAIRNFNPDRSASVTITVDQESLEHQQLLDIAAADQDPQQRDQVDNMVLFDASSGYEITYRNAYIQSDPDESRGTDSATFPWVFMCESVDRKPVTEPTNIVGK